jgi:hypothetical protein
MRDTLRTAIATLRPYPQALLTYRLDAEGTIVECGGSWDGFAIENGASRLRADHVVGRAVWDFITGTETRQLWREVFGVARARGRVFVPFRCDSPTVRRRLEMAVEVEPGGGLSIATAVLRVEPRAPEAWLSPDGQRTVGMVTSCSWCRRFLVGDEWLEVEVAVARSGLLEDEMPAITHGVCPDCEAGLHGSR